MLRCSLLISLTERLNFACRELQGDGILLNIFSFYLVFCMLSIEAIMSLFCATLYPYNSSLFFPLYASSDEHVFCYLFELFQLCCSVTFYVSILGHLLQGNDCGLEMQLSPREFTCHTQALFLHLQHSKFYK